MENNELEVTLEPMETNDAEIVTPVVITTRTEKKAKAEKATAFGFGVLAGAGGLVALLKLRKANKELKETKKKLKEVQESEEKSEED